MTGFAAAKGVFSTEVDPARPSVRGLGFKPSAVVAWWSRQDREGIEAGNQGGLGLRTANPDLVLFAPSGTDRRSVAAPGLVAGLGSACRGRQAAAAYVAPDGAPSGDVGGAQRTDVAVLSVRDRTEFAALGSVSLR